MLSYQHLVSHIKSSDKNPHIYIACTGAGAGLAYELWRMPGASSYFVGSSFTYAANETDAFVGFKVEKYCTEETAMEMAMASYIRACQFEIVNNNPGFPVGVGISAVVASEKMHRGKHRIHFAFMTPNGMFCYESEVSKREGAKAREYDEDHCNSTAIGFILKCLDVPYFNILKFKNNTKSAENLLFNKPLFKINGSRAKAISNGVFLPGTFNPIHDGHRGMRRTVEQVFNQKVTYTITSSSIHKKQMSLADMLYKAAAMRLEIGNGENSEFMFTRNDPLFIDKARMFPGSTFVIGADALMTMLDPSWGIKTVNLIKEFEELNINFYVFPREVNGQMVTQIDSIKDNELFWWMDESWDISSSELRT